MSKTETNKYPIVFRAKATTLNSGVYDATSSPGRALYAARRMFSLRFSARQFERELKPLD